MTAVAALFVAACGGSQRAMDVSAPLARSVAAEDDLKRIVAAFERGTAKDRASQAKALEEFVKVHREDPSARTAEALLAWVELDRGSYAAAVARADAVIAKGAGTPTDIAHAVRGAALRREGKPGAALDELDPLVDKLVDPFARDLLNEEIVLAALDAKRPRRALELMGVWLRESGDEQQKGVAARVGELSTRLPEDVLSDWLDKKENDRADDASLRAIVAVRVADIAKEKKDTKLAQRVLQSASMLLGDRTNDIAALAAGASRARVEGRTVGLLLTLRGGSEGARRSAEVAAGVASGLGLPSSPARLVSRDDGGSLDTIEAAMASLSAEGASVVIGGLDGATAEKMGRYASANHLPLLLLRPPSSPIDPSGVVFEVGDDPARVEADLVKALANRGAKPIALASDADAPPTGADVTLRCGEDRALDARAPSPPKVGAVALGPAASCARALADVTLAPKSKIAFSWDGFGASIPPGSLVASSGVFPIGATPSDALKGWIAEHRDPPTFWAALGHDAAVLAYASVQGLDEKATEDPKEVLARRAAAAAALARATGELWTTDAKGFADKRTLARKIEIKEAK